MLGFSRFDYYNSRVKGIELNLIGQKQGSFLDYNKTFNQMEELSGLKINAQIQDISIRKIKTELLKNPYVAEASAYTTIDGFVKYTLIERNPLLRIFTLKQQNFYIDRNGYVFPVSNHHSERVIIANGYIPEISLTGQQPISVLKDAPQSQLNTAYILAKMLESDSMLSVLIDQIYFNSLNEIELVPKIGNAEILIGSANDLHTKLHNISGFYRVKAGSDELTNYSNINAKFSNQIVCTKRDIP